MPKEPRPNPSLDELRSTWALVVEHLPVLRQVAGAMASADRRLDAEELLAEGIRDIVESAHLYDSTRAPWITWARTRMRKERTYAHRRIRKHNRCHISIGNPSRNQEEDLPIDPPVGLGQDGSADRAEARIVLGQVLEDASDPEHEAVLVILHEWSPSLAEGGRKAVGRSIRRLRDRIGAEARLVR